MRTPVIRAVAAAIFLASCGSTSPAPDAKLPEPTIVTNTVSDTKAAVDSSDESLTERLEAFDAAVAAWRSANSIEAAQVAAETAANLVVGSNGPGYGDRNGDGVISGDTTVGVLPGLNGTPPGLAAPLATNQCIERDVLGGTWIDSGAEWGAMLNAIDDWRPNNNTMPSLASHPQRIVGWATFTLASVSLDEAHEYGGHASLHVNISLRALDC